MRILKCDQRSPEWYKARCGIPTSSNFDKIIKTNGEPSKQRKKYLYRLAGERITGIAEESYQNNVMLRGIEMEAEARLLYELSTGKVVEEVGFCLASGYGASPDGLVGDDGGIEIKCPIMATHVGYLLDNVLPTEYTQQIQGQLLATGRKWIDFISYYPAMKPLIIRVERDEGFIRALEIELKLFVAELDKIVSRIK